MAEAVVPVGVTGTVAPVAAIGKAGTKGAKVAAIGTAALVVATGKVATKAAAIGVIGIPGQRPVAAVLRTPTWTTDRMFRSNPAVAGTDRFAPDRTASARIAKTVRSCRCGIRRPKVDRLPTVEHCHPHGGRRSTRQWLVAAWLRKPLATRWEAQSPKQGSGQPQAQ